MQAFAGFQEIEHTADWALKVWAPSLPDLLCQAAQGMLTLAGVRFQRHVRRKRTFTLEYNDEESLLVHFLSEIVYYIEKDHIALNRFQFGFQTQILKVHAYGYAVQSIEKMIKAVTYHGLEVKHTENGYLAQVVFDV